MVAPTARERNKGAEVVQARECPGVSNRAGPDSARQPPSGAIAHCDAPMGLAERRRHARRPVLLVMAMPLAGATVEAVCIDVSVGGAYFASRSQPQPLDTVELTVRSTVTAGQLVTLCGRVVYVVTRGGARPAGFAVAWQWARCSGSPEPLVRLLSDFMRIEHAAERVLACGQGHDFDFLHSDDGPMATMADRASQMCDMTLTQGYHDHVTIGYHAEVLAPAAIMAPEPTPGNVWPAAVPETLAARYANLELLGSGGCGVVYRARDLMLGRDVVLKFLKRDSDEMQRTYFLREVRMAGSLSHRNIVQILDVDSAQGRLYYVMQHVAGQTLGAVIRNGPLPTSDALNIVSDLAAALDHAHGKGILHRDVKPENVLLGNDGVARLFDFGLARLRTMGFGDKSLVVGTPSHMAPEQIRGGAVDHRTDLYSLGVVGYQLLTGHLPFESGNLFVAHALEPVPDPRKYRPELPIELTAVLERALAKQAAARFGSGAEFLAALEHALLEGPRGSS